MNYGKRLQLQPGDKLKFVDIERLYGYFAEFNPNTTDIYTFACYSSSGICLVESASPINNGLGVVWRASRFIKYEDPVVDKFIDNIADLIQKLA
jgi:hypothetical protein